ncbi:MAG: FGGY family carbohydrate kinase [Gordonia sp. (in: high G+C Gram-positive bacteria)]
MAQHFVVGLDLGSTGIKALLAADNQEIHVTQRPTPWRRGRGGTTDLFAEDLRMAITDLLHEIGEVVRQHHPGASVAAIAVAGMGETGFLLDHGGAPVAPAFAWFDPRGGEQLDLLPPELRTQFPIRTGLPLGVQTSAIKLAYLRANGVPISGNTWLNLPEFVVYLLGGRQVTEYSLASRTGLFEQDSQRPWGPMLHYLDTDARLLPEFVDAGTPLGQATAPWIDPACAGATLTVAGHDHLVSAVSSGHLGADQYHVSMGTAEVLLRVVDTLPSESVRIRLAENLINAVRHVVPGQYVLVAGAKTGLLMRRALQLAGITDRVGRDELDRQVCALDAETMSARGDILVSGARNDEGILALRILGDGINPAQLFRAVLDHGNAEVARLIAALDRDFPPATSTLLTGGWAEMESVCAARREVLPHVRVSTRRQDCAYGASLFAQQLITADAARA